MMGYKLPVILFISIIFSINLQAAQSEEKVVLVTGFKPFGNYDVNPSELIAENLNGTTIDGVKIFLENGWILVRPSNTEPIVKIIWEGKTEEDSDVLKEFIRNNIYPRI